MFRFEKPLLQLQGFIYRYQTFSKNINVDPNSNFMLGASAPCFILHLLSYGATEKGGHLQINYWSSDSSGFPICGRIIRFEKFIK